MLYSPELLLPEDVITGEAYKVPESTGLLKLDAMESPFAWPSNLTESIASKIDEMAFNRYPSAGAEALKASIKRYFNVPEDVDVMLGNGSDELIQILIMAMAGSGKSVFSIEPTFVMYKVIAEWLGVSYEAVPLREDFFLDIQATLAQIQATQPGLIFLATPNNPTGNLLDEQALVSIIQVAKGLVVIDEAYTAYASSDALHLLSLSPNVLILRTLSKIGLAGLRLGMLFGSSLWVQQLDKMRLPYNLNAFSQAAAIEILEKPQAFQEQASLLVDARERLQNQLRQLPSFEPFPSEANFITVRVKAPFQAKEVFSALRDQHGILIKCLDGGHPLLENCLRITVGTQDQCDRVIAAISEITS